MLPSFVFFRRLNEDIADHSYFNFDCHVFADTWGPPDGHAVLNVRTYPDGSFVFQFASPVSAGCRYNDHGVTPPTTPPYKLLSSIALMAYASGKKVRIIYNGCVGAGLSGAGGRNVTG